MSLTAKLELFGKNVGARLAGIVGVLISFALLMVAAAQVRHLSLAHILALVPNRSQFWMAFVPWYLAQPVSEWFIYRRLWHMPPAGFAALMRKMVSNELLLGYLGEAQFYGWARQHPDLAAAPFGAIKDVTILSALTGNVTTLIMLIFTAPLVITLAMSLSMRASFVSLAIVLVTSFAILLLRRRLFSLARRDLLFIALFHLARIIVQVGVGAVLWHMALPQVSLALWLVLATLRMLISRLPLVPNKDVVFAGMSVALLGRVSVSSALTMMAGLVVAAHILVGISFASADLVEFWRMRNRLMPRQG